VLDDERIQLTDDLGVAVERQLGVDQLLDGADPQLGEPRGLVLVERLVREVAQRRSGPE